MKKILLSLLITVLLPLAGCHDPEELIPPVADKGVNNLTVYATWEGYHTADESGFPSKIDYDTHTITVQVPYTLPVASDNVQKLEDYTKVYAQFNLDDNVYIEPALYTMDLTKTYEVTVTDQKKQKTLWTIKAALAKSSACDIESFSIRDPEISALIDKNGATASLVYFEQLKNVFADYTLSPHARIVPDPATTAFWCSPGEPKTFTVIAQDGITSRKWTLQQTEPARIEEGIRPGSGKLLWAKKLSQIGISTLNMTTGIAATDNYLVINTRNEDPVVLNAKNGNVEGTINLGQWKGPNRNYYMTADDTGHFIINNYVPDDGGILRILRMKDINSSPEVLIEFTTADTYGKHVSVHGDVYGDAVISAAFCGWTAGGSTSHLTWIVRNGVPEDQRPTWKQITGMKGWTNGDLVYTGPEITSDYFACGYSSNSLTWVDGATNTAKAHIDGTLTGNEQMLAVDAALFNNILYATASMETSFTYGVAGAMWVFEAKYPQTFEGAIKTSPTESLPSAVVYELDRGADGYGKYGGRLNDGQNSNAYTDVALHVTSDGYFMYAYFMFCNGYVGCIQFDCIAQ